MFINIILYIMEKSCNYIQKVGDYQTSRIASERQRDGLDVQEIETGQRSLAIDMRKFFSEQLSQRANVAVSVDQYEPLVMQGIEKSVLFGAPRRERITDYFQSNPQRSQSNSLEKARSLSAHSEMCTTILQHITSTSTADNTSIANAARTTFTKMIDYFQQHDTTDTQQNATDVAVFFDACTITYDADTKAPIVMLSEADYHGLQSLYHLERHIYTTEELMLANEMGASHDIQKELMQYHLQITTLIETIVNKNPDYWRDNLTLLDPFTEFGVIYDEGQQLSCYPNPKLIKVLMNNFMPMVARKLLSLETETPSLPDLFCEAARDKDLSQCFAMHIPKFNEIDGSIYLSGISRNHCPAHAIMLKSLLSKRS